MIAASLLLILVAVVLLGIGLARGDNASLIGSIAASLLAAITLVVGARKIAGDGLDEPDELDDGFGGEPEDAGDRSLAEPDGLGGGVRAEADDTERDDLERDDAERDDHGDPVSGRPVGPTAQAMTPAATAPEIPAQAGAPTGAAQAGAPVGQPDPDEEDEDPPDEPPPQDVSPADAARVARLSEEVLVVDERPRYHLADCDHLRGRPSEPLPVSEAVELGFTPCGRCAPVSALLARATRG